MKKIFLLASILIAICSHAQVVDESINGVQVGFLGVWLHNESKIAPNWAFRTEIGYESPLSSGITNGNDYLPVISFEPRWYYNSPKRQGNSKNWFHNSSNYATLAIRYYPEFWVLSFDEIDEVDGGVFLIPTWGIRRNISYRINYELGIGAGIDVYELLTDESSTTDFILNLHFRIGYKFGKF